MPNYEYKCKCGFEFEEFRAMADRAKAACPQCGSVAKQQISVPAFAIFKPFFHKNLAKDPIEIRSKAQLKDECKARGVKCPALE